MTLQDRVKISSKFVRSTRIDADSLSGSLDGFVFSPSLKKLLIRMGEQQRQSHQGAYTWTGPYGSGKSSLAAVLARLIGGPTNERKKASNAVGDDHFVQQITEQFQPKQGGWTFLNVVGELVTPHRAIAKRINACGISTIDENATADDVIEKLTELAARKPEDSGGLFLIIDEMGKFLEHSAAGANDIYFFQQLAERAARSNGRMIVVGILHQAFQEYANKLGRNVRDEWAKIQGRFTDIPVNVSADEQLTLISQAIISDKTPKKMDGLAARTIALLKTTKFSSADEAKVTLKGTWPLHPLAAIVLGPLSKKSYGQNQRSIFTFLSSAESGGLQDFLTSHGEDELYRLGDLWDYLIQNLYSSIAISADSHHFSNAMEALELVAPEYEGQLEELVLKSIALLELTRNQSGLGASEEAVILACDNFPKSEVQSALKRLLEKSVIVFRHYRGTFGLFEGSDFDIENALEEASREVTKPNLTAISEAIGFSAISAKRHYHETGTMRWFDFKVLPADELKDVLQKRAKSQAFGCAVLALPTNDEPLENIKAHLIELQSSLKNEPLLLATSPEGGRLVSLARSHTLLSHILDTRQEVARDKVARREIRDRLEATTNLINQEIWSILNSSIWIKPSGEVEELSWPLLNSAISDIASQKFAKAPIIHNELLNRRNPSGSANAGLKQLLHAMVLREEKEQLGFVKYPAEKGLYCSILEANGLHQKVGQVFKFVSPSEIEDNTFLPIWRATKSYLHDNAERSVALNELYNLWGEEPFGVTDGLMPLIAVLFLITERSNLAFYREGIFLSRFTDIDVDYLLKAPELINVRWMDMSELSRKLLSNLAGIASDISGRPVLNLEPLDVARSLIAAFDSIAPWVHKTSKLSQNAIQIRALFKRSTDPNKFLFDDIPALYAAQVKTASKEGVEFITQNIKDGLVELIERYPLMLHKLRDQVLHELQVPSLAPQAIKELNERAKTIKGITGDMRLEAFIGRLCQFENEDSSIEQLVGLAINKPAKSWVDSDIDKAAVALIHFAQQFNKHETIVRVDGRKGKREAMAVVVGMDGRPVPIVQEFDVLDSEKASVDKIATEFQAVLSKYPALSQNVALAALATVSASVIGAESKGDEEEISNG